MPPFKQLKIIYEDIYEHIIMYKSKMQQNIAFSQHFINCNHISTLLLII